MTGRKRLRILANYLVSGAVDEDEFDMCNWAHCAIGEGASLPTLVNEGLELTTTSNGNLVPNYEGQEEYQACRKFFGISYDDAKKFFGPTQRKAVTVGRQLLAYLK